MQSRVSEWSNARGLAADIQSRTCLQKSCPLQGPHPPPFHSPLGRTPAEQQCARCFNGCEEETTHVAIQFELCARAFTRVCVWGNADRFTQTDYVACFFRSRGTKRSLRRELSLLYAAGTGSSARATLQRRSLLRTAPRAGPPSTVLGGGGSADCGEAEGGGRGLLPSEAAREMSSTHTSTSSAWETCRGRSRHQ